MPTLINLFIAFLLFMAEGLFSAHEVDADDENF